MVLDSKPSVIVLSRSRLNGGSIKFYVALGGYVIALDKWFSARHYLNDETNWLKVAHPSAALLWRPVEPTMAHRSNTFACFAPRASQH